MSEDLRIYSASQPLPPGRTGILTAFEPGTRTLEAGFQIAPQFLPVPVDIVFEKDVAITLRDGVTIYLDVFRPVGSKKFEAPEPAYWCAQGYAICNPDIRGVIDSDGNSALWDRQEGRDCYDVVEWLTEQEWCSGKVGMSGTSYLAVAQWFTAAEQPPHLAAINPWEGVSDVYRDLVMRGGIPDTGFAQQLQDGSFRTAASPERTRKRTSSPRWSATPRSVSCGKTRSRSSRRSPCRRTSWPVTRTRCTPRALPHLTPDRIRERVAAYP